MGNNQSSGSSSQHSSPSGHFARSRSTTASSVNGSAQGAADAHGSHGQGHGHSHGAVSSNSQHSHANADVPLSDKTVDGGTLEPSSHLFASSVQDYSRPVVHRLILERRLAPFHLGLDDYEDEWTVEQIVEALDEAEQQAARKLEDAHASAVEAVIEAEATMQTTPLGSTRKSKDSQVAVAHATIHRERLAELIKHRERRAAAISNRPHREVARQDLAKQYLGKAVECPICFLYYPPPMVHTRCCDQPICTECFVQIKRAEPTTTHLESEPAACPFCMEPNFGCVYTKEMAPPRPTVDQNDSNGSGSNFSIVAGVAGEQKRRRKSFAHTEKDVVTTGKLSQIRSVSVSASRSSNSTCLYLLYLDQVHPDWEAKVEAIRATVARRANRRIVFRQVGERLIPVGVTSGRAGDGSNPTMSSMQLPPRFAAQVAAAMDSNATGRSSRSSRRRNQEMAEMLAGLGGQDLEELMIEEAMRISMLEDEARQRKEREDRDKAAAAAAQTAGNATPVERSSLDATCPSDAFAPGSPSTRTMVSEAISAPMGNLSLGSNTTSPTSPTSPTTPTGSLLPASAHAAPPTLSAKPTSSTDTSAPSSLSPSRTSLPPLAPPAATPSTLQDGSALTPAISTASSVSSISELSSTAGFEPLGDGSDDDTDERLEEDGRRRQESSSDAVRLIDV